MSRLSGVPRLFVLLRGAASRRPAVVGAVVALAVALAAAGAWAVVRDPASERDSLLSEVPTQTGVGTQPAASATPSATPSPRPSPQTTQAALSPDASWDGKADAAYDAAHPHSGLPTNCEPGHGCAYEGAHGATPAGPYGATAVVSGSTVTVTWRTEGLGGGPYTGPTKEFVVDVWDRDWSHQYVRREVPLDRRSTTFTGIPPGKYYAWVQELNDSGLSSGVTADFDIAPRPTPSPTPSAEPSVTASPTASPTPSPPATPAA